MSWLDWTLAAAVIVLVPAFWVGVGVLVGRWISRRK